jgi:RND family efflux transporter MFP subunit
MDLTGPKSSLLPSALKVGCTLALLSLFPLLSGCGSGESGIPREKRPVAVEVTRAIKGSVNLTFPTTGTITPKQEALISPKIGGRIERIYVDEGDETRKGKVLVELERDRLEIAEKEAQAALREAEAQLRNLQAVLKRRKKLFGEGVVGEEVYEDTSTEVALAEARVERAQAVLATARQDLEDSVIRAPFDGFVVEKRMNEGEMASATASSAILWVMDIRTVEVECGLSEDRRRFVRVGDEVLVEVDAYPGETFGGKVTTVNPMVDPESRTFKIKIEILNETFRLESGMFARVKVIQRVKDEAVLIPLRAVTERQGDRVVFAVDGDVARMKVVEVGMRQGDLVEVIRGVDDKVKAAETSV